MKQEITKEMKQGIRKEIKKQVKISGNHIGSIKKILKIQFPTLFIFEDWAEYINKQYKKNIQYNSSTTF